MQDLVGKNYHKMALRPFPSWAAADRSGLPDFPLFWQTSPLGKGDHMPVRAEPLDERPKLPKSGFQPLAPGQKFAKLTKDLTGLLYSWPP
jgi:hypothetical protein